MTLENFHIPTFSETLLSPLGWVWVIIWLQYGYLITHGDPRSGHWAHLARATPPPKSFKIAVCRWFKGIWCVHKLLS